MRITSIVVLATTLAFAGCDKQEGAGAPGGSAAPGGTSAATAAPAAATGTKLTHKQLDDAYALADASNLEKSLAAVTAKLGPPAKNEGGTHIWYGLENGKTCYALKLSSSQSELGTVDEALCK